MTTLTNSIRLKFVNFRCHEGWTRFRKRYTYSIHSDVSPYRRHWQTISVLEYLWLLLLLFLLCSMRMHAPLLWQFYQSTFRRKRKSFISWTNCTRLGTILVVVVVVVVFFLSLQSLADNFRCVPESSLSFIYAAAHGTQWQYLSIYWTARKKKKWKWKDNCFRHSMNDCRCCCCMA